MTSRDAPTPVDVQRIFDPHRLAQVRIRAGMTKKELADRLGVSPAAVGQYEAGGRPRPELIPVLGQIFGVPIGFFAAGRPHARLDSGGAHFRSLRSTRAYQRGKAVALVEQGWEITYALESHVQLPYVDVPGFAGGEMSAGAIAHAGPTQVARELRAAWSLGKGPIPHLVRQMEAHGIVVLSPPADPDVNTVDAYSTSHLPRPFIVLTPNRSDDVYRQRFTAAHELGHILLHGDSSPGDIRQEREADAFAAEFLTPEAVLTNELPARVDFARLVSLQKFWGVSVKSLLYRSRELGRISDSAAIRAYQRFNHLWSSGVFHPEPVSQYAGERPVMLQRAFDLAVSEVGTSIQSLADELRWPPEWVELFVSDSHSRPKLRLVSD